MNWTIGTCSICGGAVTAGAPATCSACGAIAAQHGPVIPMVRPAPMPYLAQPYPYVQPYMQPFAPSVTPYPEVWCGCGTISTDTAGGES